MSAGIRSFILAGRIAAKNFQLGSVTSPVTKLLELFIAPVFESGLFRDNSGQDNNPFPTKLSASATEKSYI